MLPPAYSRTARFLTRGAILLLLALIVGCDSRVHVLGPGGTTGGRTGGGTGGSAIDAALVGQWRRTLYFTGSSGSTHLSETVWEFLGDGTATRTVLTVNLTIGWGDRVVTEARWTTQSGRLVITYLTTSAGTVAYDYRIDGRTLFIAGQAYGRIG